MNRVELDSCCSECYEEGHLVRKFDIEDGYIECCRCGFRVGGVHVDREKLIEGESRRF